MRQRLEPYWRYLTDLLVSCTCDLGRSSNASLTSGLYVYELVLESDSRITQEINPQEASRYPDPNHWVEPKLIRRETGFVVVIYPTWNSCFASTANYSQDDPTTTEYKHAQSRPSSITDITHPRVPIVTIFLIRLLPVLAISLTLLLILLCRNVTNALNSQMTRDTAPFTDMPKIGPGPTASESRCQFRASRAATASHI